MADKYGTGDGPYCYPGTDVLKDKLGISSAPRLDEAELAISMACAAEIEFTPPPYNLDVLQSIHFQLFSDVYDWAGEIRTVDISKSGTRFCTSTRIVPEATNLLQQLNQLSCFTSLARSELIDRLAWLYGELNITQPFREGNDRAQRVLFEHIVVNCGFEISWNTVERIEWIEANIASVG